MKKKILLPVLAIGLVICCAVGVTFAWLIDVTKPVVNTFTTGDITITLDETTTDFKMVPGNPIAKDPKVTVEAGSEACWVFVKVEKSSNYDQFLEPYAMADDWTYLLKDADGNDIYYHEIDAYVNSDTPLQVLKGSTVNPDGEVTVKTDVTKQMMNGLTSETYPTLTFTAYAVQKDGFETAFEAWTEVLNLPPNQ